MIKIYLDIDTLKSFIEVSIYRGINVWPTLMKGVFSALGKVKKKNCLHSLNVVLDLLHIYWACRTKSWVHQLQQLRIWQQFEMSSI